MVIEGEWDFVIFYHFKQFPGLWADNPAKHTIKHVSAVLDIGVAFPILVRQG